MEALIRDGDVLRDTLTFREIFDETALVRVNLRGRVVCRDGVVLVVNKWLRVRRGSSGRNEVLGEFYSYQAYRRGKRPVPILRYDNAHGSEIHRHFFDPAGREIGTQRISMESLPRLDLVIREAIAIATGSPIPSS